MSVFRLPTGVTHRSAAFAYRGGSFFDARDFAMPAVLVRHPCGDVLVDTGFGRDVDAHLRAMPIALRAITRATRGLPAADQLAAAGYDPRRLRAILLTLQRTLGDQDPAAVRENLLRMAAIAARFPELVLAPAHDARGFEGLPRL